MLLPRVISRLCFTVTTANPRASKSTDPSLCTPGHRPPPLSESGPPRPFSFPPPRPEYHSPPPRPLAKDISTLSSVFSWHFASAFIIVLVHWNFNFGGGNEAECEVICKQNIAPFPPSNLGFYSLRSQLYGALLWWRIAMPSALAWPSHCLSPWSHCFRSGKKVRVRDIIN